ncbi:MAG TPA: hypothetical protein VF789_16715 [Thermoanaerobaculia bacterium]
MGIAAQGKPGPVNADNFVRAETDRSEIDKQEVVRRNRDTIYSRVVSGTWIFPEAESVR